MERSNDVLAVSRRLACRDPGLKPKLRQGGPQPLRQLDPPILSRLRSVLGMLPAREDLADLGVPVVDIPPPQTLRLFGSESGVETGAVMKLSITPEVLEAYRHARETRNHGLQSFCRWAGVGFLRVRADQPFFEIVRTAIARGWLAP